MAGGRGKRKGRDRRAVGGILLLAAFLILVGYSLALRYGVGLPDLRRLFARDEPPAEAAAPDVRTPANAQPARGDEGEEEPLRLQILNGTGVTDLALDTGNALREWGVDAIDRGNAPPWPFPETMLLVRNGHRLQIHDLARRLGGVPVIIQRREDLMLDATLILGHDWEKYDWPAQD